MCGFTLLSLHSDSTGPFLFLWIIHGSPVEGRLNWDVVVLSLVLGGSRALGRKLFVVPNIGAGTREMRAMMVWGLSLCLATAWVQGISLLACGTWFLSSFAGLEGGGLKCTRGGARGDRPLSGRRCRFTVSYLLCLLLSAWLRPVRHSWCTVYILNTSSTSLIISHACLRWTWLFGACWTALYVVGVSLFCEAGSAVSRLVTRQLWWLWFACLAAAWEAFGFVHCILDGATRGRCLIVLWGRERCQRTGYTAVMVAVVCMPGCGLGGIWICTLYFGRRYTW